MVLIYNIILMLLAIVLLPVILIAFVIQPKFRAGFWEKLGFYNFKNEDKKSTIFHAVSVGETNAIKDLVKLYRERHPEETIIVTKQGHISVSAIIIFSGLNTFRNDKMLKKKS